MLTYAGDDMRKVGAIFQSDWLSLWALNVELQNFDPPPATEILIGRLCCRRETLSKACADVC
jgi:hypothetical protein